MKTTLRKCLPFVLALSAAALMTGCGHLGKSMAKPEQLLDKAEFATGIDRSQLSVVEGSVEGTMDSVQYRVKAKNGKVFRCYYTTIIYTTSDAICTPIDRSGRAMEQQKKKTREDGNCNELLRAAGRC